MMAIRVRMKRYILVVQASAFLNLQAMSTKITLAYSSIFSIGVFAILSMRESIYVV